MYGCRGCRSGAFHDSFPPDDNHFTNDAWEGSSRDSSVARFVNPRQITVSSKTGDSRAKFRIKIVLYPDIIHDVTVIEH